MTQRKSAPQGAFFVSSGASLRSEAAGFAVAEVAIANGLRQLGTVVDARRDGHGARDVGGADFARGDLALRDSGARFCLNGLARDARLSGRVVHGGGVDF